MNTKFWLLVLGALIAETASTAQLRPNPSPGYFDPCNSTYAGRYSNGETAVFELRRAAISPQQPNEIKVRIFIQRKIVYMGLGECRPFEPGSAEVIMDRLNGPDHSARVDRAVLTGRQNGGQFLRFEAEWLN